MEQQTEMIILQETDAAYERLSDVVVNAMESPASQRMYRFALRRYLEWWRCNGRPPFDRSAVQQYMQTAVANYAQSTRALHLSALKKMASEARLRGWITEQECHGILFLRSPARRGKRCGRWLTSEQAAQLLRMPDASTLAGARDLALLALLFGAALRRDEAVRVTADQVQMRNGRWCLVDLTGKGRRVRTIPLSDEMAGHIMRWLSAAGIKTGPILRRINRYGGVAGALTAQGVYYIVTKYASRLGIKLSPHDMRRTFAALAYLNGCPVDIISESLGHSSPATTRAYVGQVIHLTRGSAACDYISV